MYKKEFKCFSLILALMIILNMNIVAFAESTENEDYIKSQQINENYNEEISSRAINYYTVYFKKVSTTTAKAQVNAEGTALTKEMSSTITLQKYDSKNDVYNTVKTVKKNVSGTSITHEKTFTISTSGTYRIKVTLSDGSTTHIKYKKLS